MVDTIPWKLGPHDQDGGPRAKEWAARSNVVKACGNPAVLHVAPDHAIRLWRWPFGQPESTRILAEKDVVGAANQIISPLAGYNHPRLWVEGLNEVPRQLFKEHVWFMKLLKIEIEARGYQFTGPSSATGDFELEDVAHLRTVGLNLWTFHGYMTRERGPTIWNAYRMRQFWMHGDPPVIYSEAGFDRCRDGHLHENEGYLPKGDGPYGWEFQFQGVEDPDHQAARQLIHYARGLTEPWEWGATVFTTTPKEEWLAKGFNTDPLIPSLMSQYIPWSPHMPRPNDWCPFAERDELSSGLWSPIRDDNATPSMICDHIADGMGDPGPWWESLLSGPPNKRASAHFWISKVGKLKQYVPISGQAWSNGNKCEPDVTNPMVKRIIDRGANPNAATVSIEHEGRPGEQFPLAQTDMSRRLHRWLYDHHHIALNRTSVVGHYQFDSCTRKNCPGPSFPWGAVLGGPVMVQPTDSVVKVRDEAYSLGGKLQELGKRAATLKYPHLSSYLENQGEAIKDTMVIQKGEK